ncbi:hypothetical protein CSX00_06310 [Pseudobutyrivibrio ruminis]|uniref:Glycosyltransferase family 1 protein n=1 Tax=Pseudobutyrivibrio ruminis TaxID=46206 RepID=A0A2G3EAM7_9FIRM|nr:glycosyltransferase [Pseudobutyrivibrio ruminis]PHU40378.1 hypothetical protein CSX00_06310 [Pseudobutyrivibrio ruminis]
MDYPIRVLQITDCIKHGAGVASVIMNYYRHMDDSRVVFDFMVNEPVNGDIKREIEARGSRIFVMPSLSVRNTFKYKRELEDFFREHEGEYQIIHGHTPNAAAYYMPIAKKYGVPIRILHSHNSRGSDSKIKRVRNRIMSNVAIKNATHRFACSKVAAEFLYGNDDAFILNNAIDLDGFAFDEEKRRQIRDELGIDESTILIGHIGRMAEQKNHKFILEIAEALRGMGSGSSYKFLLLGDGPLRHDIERQIKAKNIEDMIILAGVVSNPRDYYQAMDEFILPSLYEGLPVVGVEAQAAGLPTCISDKVTPETMMVDNISMLSFDNAKEWADWIIENPHERSDNKKQLQEKGYDIKTEAGVLIDKYFELMDERGI